MRRPAGLPYELICDGQDVDLGDAKYLLSPQDLAAYDLVPELIEAGVARFKIEGRLKTPEYVATSRGTIVRRSMLQRPAVSSPPREMFEEMELSFSRGFSPGWLGGCDHKMLVPGLSSSKRGVRLGEVRSLVEASTVVVWLTASSVGGTASCSKAIGLRTTNKEAAILRIEYSRAGDRSRDRAVRRR